MKIEEKKISKTQYCPQCFDEGKVTSVVAGEIPKALYCPIHGIVGWEAQGAILEYVEKKVSIPDPPFVEEELEKETPEEPATEEPKEEESKEDVEEPAEEEDEEVVPEDNPAEDTKE